MSAVAKVLRNAQLQITEAVVQLFAASPTRFRVRDATAYRSLIASLVEGVALASFGNFMPGSPDNRELEHTAVSLGVAMANDGAGSFDIGALLDALRRECKSTLGELASHRIDDLFAWLILVATESQRTSAIAALGERYADEIENGTYTVLLTPRLPAVFWVGSPSTAQVERIVSRSIMLAVSASAKQVLFLVDGLSTAGFAALAPAHTSMASPALPVLSYVIVGSSRLCRELVDSWSTSGISAARFAEISDAFRYCGVRLDYSE